MASCLVPDFPAVMVALEHLKELEKQLKEERLPFAPEATVHLIEITAAITELETDRRVGHEHLEVETIENSKLRHKIDNIHEQMSQKITADVAAARASNAEEIEQLHKELNAVSQLREAAVKRHEALTSQNKALCPNREQRKAEHEEVIATLNNELSLKYDLQMQLGQIQEQIVELTSGIAAAEQNKEALEQNMVLEREACARKKDNLSSELNRTGEKIKQQKQNIRRRRRELDRVNAKKQETHGHLEELTTDVTKLESNYQQLTASRCHFEKQLEGETQKYQDLRQQREMLRKEICEYGEGFRIALQCLKGKIGTVEGKIEESRASRLLSVDRLADISEIFRHQRDEENEVRAEYIHVSQQLERSKLKLEERMASVVKRTKEIKEMDMQIIELTEVDTINEHVFERNQEELCGNMDTEKKNIRHFEEERSRLRTLLEETKRTQEEHVAKLTSDIGSTNRKHEELRQEEAALHQRQPKSVDGDMLLSHVTQCEVEYRQTEMECHQEIEKLISEIESITRRNGDKQMETKERGEMLKEVEHQWSIEQHRHQRLKTLTPELKQRRAELEQSIQGLKEDTSSLLQPKERMKAELEETRARYMGVLDQQASELRAVETSIGDSHMKLKLVSMENSRLHLCIRQMTAGVSWARRDRDRYQQEIQQFNQDSEALFERLQAAWREDALVTEDCQSCDGVVLGCLSVLLNRLKSRSQHLATVNALLQQQMLDFSKRQGNKTTTDNL